MAARAGAVNLREAAEQQRLLLGGYARALVVDRDHKALIVRVPTRRDLDLALLAEFHRVADQVQQQLAQPAGIDRQPLRQAGGRKTQGEFPGRGCLAEQGQGLAADRRRIGRLAPDL